MDVVDTADHEGYFQIVAGTDRSQAGLMTIDPGEAAGGPGNNHPDSDQWLFVVSGSGSAVVEGETVALEPGRLLLIEAGEDHAVRNDGDEPLETVNVYAPPDYR